MEKIIELEECPCCRGDGMLIHEGGWSVQVECANCGSHTVYVEYETEEAPDRVIVPPCVMSVRGYGKFIVNSLSEHTRKGRIRLDADKYV